MRYFSTEFPHRPLRDKSEFVAQVVGWLRGTTYSTVLDHVGETELDGIAPIIRADSGEELRFRFFEENQTWAIGFRHDFPDDEGRLWHTEAVCRHGAGRNNQDLIRLRTQCIAKVPGARIDVPRKPFLLKSILAEGWGGTDGLINISDKPIKLHDEDENLSLARAVVMGNATFHLPIIYFLAAKSGWALPVRQIEKLAYDLGGVAHVLVEPSRSFSFRLRDHTDARNVYGGAIGFSSPSKGFIRRFNVDKSTNKREIQTSLQRLASVFRSQLPSEGWDWTELQEQALRQQRERDRNRLSTTETEALYEEEIANLREQVSQLKSQSIQPDIPDNPDLEGNLLPAPLVSSLGPEIYPGEIMDRIRAASKIALSRSEQEGLDERTQIILQRISQLEHSPGLTELLEDIKRVTKNSSRMASDLSDLLCRHGYKKKPQRKHVVLESNVDFAGIEALTISTTPGDERGLKNMRKQVERALGLPKLTS